MRKTVIAGNWKMNMTPTAAGAFIRELAPMVKGKDKCDIVLCVPFVDIATAAEAAKGTNIRIGAQNVHFEAKGAFTGEIAADMLLEAGAEYVIVGHSERRQYFGETDTTVNLRTKAALAAGLKVILCLGEVKEQRLSGITDEVVAMQTKLDLAGISEDQLKNVIIAYEPDKAAEEITIQYGGSMNDGNAAELLAKVNVDGGLIGGASLKTDKFTAIVNAANA